MTTSAGPPEMVRPRLPSSASQSYGRQVDVPALAQALEHRALATPVDGPVDLAAGPMASQKASVPPG